MYKTAAGCCFPVIPFFSSESSAGQGWGEVGEGQTEEEREREEGGGGEVDPLRGYTDYYLQAEHSVEALVNIRYTTLCTGTMNYIMYIHVQCHVCTMMGVCVCYMCIFIVDVFPCV